MCQVGSVEAYLHAEWPDMFDTTTAAAIRVHFGTPSLKYPALHWVYDSIISDTNELSSDFRKKGKLRNYRK